MKKVCYNFCNQHLTFGAIVLTLHILERGVRMEEKRPVRRRGRSRIVFTVLAVCPLFLSILIVVLFIYGEMQGIKSVYHIDSEDIESPYSIFDKVKLLNAYTKDDYQGLQDQAMRNSSVFLDEKYLEGENQKLSEKYSFLAVIVDGKFTYFGRQECYDDVYRGLLQENNNVSGENAQYYGTSARRYLLKKLGVLFSDGRSGSVCIITDLNVNLPHITIFTYGLVIMVAVISILVIIAIIGYAYYNIILPIRKLQAAVMRIRAGDMDCEIRAEGATEFKELYDELDDMRVALKESIEERNKADALTKEVIGNISHDLKTPLTAIKGYSEGILDGVASTPERVNKYVKTIYTKAVDMAGLVDELSYFTKIYQREEEFKFREINVNRYFGECIGDMALDLETREIQLLYQCYVQEEAVLWLDREKIKRVVSNIIGNAVKYISHNQGMILINISENTDDIIVMIRDNGKGIREEELPFIFDRFYRTDSSRNSRTGGSGLGLAIAKKIIEEHGGKIWAESVIDKGTTIYFSIPRLKERKMLDEQNTNRGRRIADCGT